MKYTFPFFLLRIAALCSGILFPVFLIISSMIQDPKPIPVYLYAIIIVTSIALFLTRNMHYRRKYIDNMSGDAFEHYCKAWFRIHGYHHIRVTQKSRDFGADLVMRKGLHRIVVQAKRYDRNIGVGAIQQAMAAKAYYNATHAIVITNQYFTPSARKLAEVNDVQLYDRYDLFGIPQKKQI